VQNVEYIISETHIPSSLRTHPLFVRTRNFMRIGSPFRLAICLLA